MISMNVALYDLHSKLFEKAEEFERSLMLL